MPRPLMSRTVRPSASADPITASASDRICDPAPGSDSMVPETSRASSSVTPPPDTWPMPARCEYPLMASPPYCRDWHQRSAARGAVHTVQQLDGRQAKLARRLVLALTERQPDEVLHGRCHRIAPDRCVNLECLASGPGRDGSGFAV